MKERILTMLRECSDRYISGEALSEGLGVSRTAVWKVIRELKEEGYEIDASSKKGYRLNPSKKILNSFEISYKLNTGILGSKVLVFKTLDSTNTYAKKAADEGCPEGTLVVADSQTAGRGRLGRLWNSAGGKGIWMSVVLRPSMAPEDIQLITLGASVAVVASIKKTTGIDARIKWPNDIIIQGRKVCGILTEMNSEQDRVNYVVLGIGINVNHGWEDFPEELQLKATSLRLNLPPKGHEASILCSDACLERLPIIRELLLELENVYVAIKNGDSQQIIERWKDLSVTLGKEVRVTVRGVAHTGVAAGITMDGKLVVDCSDGIRREIASGEVMVRGLLGYI